MSRKITLGNEARKQLIAGASKLADAVCVTMGPSGKVSVLQGPDHSFKVTKDGVSVARQVFLEEPLEDIGAQLVKEVAAKTAEQAGDGTTTATVLARSLITNHQKETSLANAVLVKKGMELACKDVVEALKNMSKPCKTQKDIKKVALISSNNDEEIAEIVSSAYKNANTVGTVTVTEGTGLKDELEMVPGYPLRSGYLSSYFINDPQTRTCELHNPLILIYQNRLTEIHRLLPLLNKIAKTQPRRSLVLIVDELKYEALSVLVANSQKGIVPALAVEAPRTREELEDLAALTGTTVIGEDSSKELENLEIEDLGTAKTVTSTYNRTSILTEKKDISEYIKVLENDKKDNSARIAKLKGGIAIISAGGTTNAEMKERKDRIEDAIEAVKSALEEGTVIGGGIALTLACQNIKDYRDKGPEIEHGANLVFEACYAPKDQILKNIGTEDESELDETALDPTKVVRCALENAVSLAGLILTAESVVSRIPDKNLLKVSHLTGD